MSRMASAVGVSGVTVSTGLVMMWVAALPFAATSMPSGRTPPPNQSTSRWSAFPCTRRPPAQYVAVGDDADDVLVIVYHDDPALLAL
jgi:hypothetical protein